MTAKIVATHVIIESPAGTAAATPSTAAMLLAKAVFTEGGSGNIARASTRPYLDPDEPGAVHGRFWNVALDGEIKAATAAGAVPDIDPILRSCGLDATPSAGVSITYDTVPLPDAAASVESCTIWSEETKTDGMIYEAWGCRGTFDVTFGTQAGLRYTSNMVGGYEEPITNAVGYYESATYNAGVSLATLADATPVALGAWGDAVLRSGSISLGYTPVVRPSMGGTAALGYHKWPAGLTRADNAPLAVNLVLEFPLVASQDLHGLHVAGTPEDVVLIFAAGSRTLTITLRQVVWTSVVRNDEGPVTCNLTGTAAKDGALSALTMVFA